MEKGTPISPPTCLARRGQARAKHEGQTSEWATHRNSQSQKTGRVMTRDTAASSHEKKTKKKQKNKKKPSPGWQKRAATRCARLPLCRKERLFYFSFFSVFSLAPTRADSSSNENACAEGRKEVTYKGIQSSYIGAAFR